MKVNSNMVYGTLLALLLWFGCTGVRNLGEKAVVDSNEVVEINVIAGAPPRCPYCDQVIGVEL